MQTFTTLLDEEEPKWRDRTRRNTSELWSRIPIIKDGKPQPDRDWHFSTDLKRINALIFRDEALQEKFRERVAQYWDGDPEELARATLQYLLDHELNHPLEAPFSTRASTGTDDNDNTKIHRAIRRGLLKAQPSLSPLEQLMRVSATQNMVKDFILDNKVYLDNQREQAYRDDVIPIWDFLELDTKEKSETNAYTITRFLYGVMYGNEKVHEFFADKTGKKGVEAAVKTMNALLKHDTARKRTILERFTKNTQPFEDLPVLCRETRAVFTSADRYTGIERFIEVLAPYITAGKPQGRCDYHGEGSGASSQDVLQDLLADMSEAEQQGFLSELQQELQGQPSYSGDNEEDSVSEWNVTNEEMNDLEVTAMHEFYKRHKPEVTIVGGNKEGESVVVGKKRRFKLKDTKVVTEEQLNKLNLARLARFQKRTRLPVIIPLDNGMYQLNEYDIKVEKVKDIVYVDTGLDVPEVVEFYLDSSGSMFDGDKRGFNDSSRWDMSSNVLYGYVHALYQASTQLGKPCSIRIHNVGGHQVSSRLVSVQEFWDKAPVDVLKTTFTPENGYAEEDLNIKVQSDGKRRSYVIVTDGELVIGGRTRRESKKMMQLAKQPQTDVILFEIGGTYGLGRAVSSNPEIHYHPVHDKETMLQHGLEVLLQNRVSGAKNTEDF